MGIIPRSGGLPASRAARQGQRAMAGPLHLLAREADVTLYFYRLMGAAALDGDAYEGIEADPRVTAQAAVTVLLASLAAGVGSLGWRSGEGGTFVMVSVVAMLTWVAWAMLTFQIGARMLPEPQTEVTLGQMLRTIGFAAAPGLLQVFAVFPRMTALVFTATTIWMFAAMVVGVRHALDYRSTTRALTVCAAAAGLAAAMAVVFGLLFGPALS
jgi:hypothetical protein